MAGPPKPPATPDPSLELDAPAGLTAITFDDGQSRYVMLSFQLDGAEDCPPLTVAEREVLECVLDGQTNAAIAKKRGTAERTVANQVAALFEKFGVSSRLDLARRASNFFVERSDQPPAPEE